MAQAAAEARIYWKRTSTMSEKRKRGRPAGPAIDDSEALAKIADLLVATPKITMNAASWTVLRGGQYKGASDNAIITRWRSRWLEVGQSELVAADRRAAKAADIQEDAGSVSRAGYAVGSKLTSSNAAKIAMGSNWTVMDQMFREQERMNRLLNPDPLGILRRINDQQKLMDKITEQQRLMDRINEHQRLMDIVMGRRF